METASQIVPCFNKGNKEDLALTSTSDLGHCISKQSLGFKYEAYRAKKRSNGPNMDFIGMLYNFAFHLKILFTSRYLHILDLQTF